MDRHIVTVPERRHERIRGVREHLGVVGTALRRPRVAHVDPVVREVPLLLDWLDVDCDDGIVLVMRYVDHVSARADIERPVARYGNVLHAYMYDRQL